MIVHCSTLCCFHECAKDIILGLARDLCLPSVLSWALTIKTCRDGFTSSFGRHSTAAPCIVCVQSIPTWHLGLYMAHVVHVIRPEPSTAVQLHSILHALLMIHCRSQAQPCTLWWSWIQKGQASQEVKATAYHCAWASESVAFIKKRERVRCGSFLVRKS